MLTLKVCETFTELQKAVFLWDINWSVDKAKKKTQKKQMVDFFFFSHNAKAQNNETTFLPGTFLEP